MGELLVAMGVGGGVRPAGSLTAPPAAVALASKIMVEKTTSPSLEYGTPQRELDVAVTDLERLLAAAR